MRDLKIFVTLRESAPKIFNIYVGSNNLGEYFQGQSQDLLVVLNEGLKNEFTELVEKLRALVVDLCGEHANYQVDVLVCNFIVHLEHHEDFDSP